MENDNEIYRDLQRHLDRSPVGFPATESGVELRMLQHLLTPEEVKIATQLSTIELEPVKRIHKRVSKSGLPLSIEELEQKLDHMVYKGTILAYQEGYGEKRYKNAGVTAGGMIDFQVDRLTPGLAPEVAARLGAHEAGAADVNAACAGFLFALDDAAGLVESGRARCVLVVGAEALSRIIDYEDRSTAVLFGDGAGAVVVAGGELERGLPPFEVHSDGVNADLLYAERDERLLRMHGREVYRHAVKRMTDATVAALRRSGLEAGDVDLFVPHQANARIIEATAKKLRVPPEKVFTNVDRYGNTSAASIPIALDEARQTGRLKAGDLVAAVAFGAGFTWGSLLFKWAMD